MPDEVKKAEESAAEGSLPKKRRSFFSLRGLLWLLGGVLILLAVGFIGAILAFRLGYVDSYVKSSLEERFAEFGIRAEIGSLRTTLSPTTTEIKDLVLYDQQSNEKLAKIDVLKLDLTISNLLALRDRRTITVNSTDVEGLEVWVRFDENGRSNFSNLKFKVDEDPNLKVSLASMNFNLKDAIVHYGDQMRKLSGTARNLQVLVEPEDPAAPENEKRYKFDLTSNKSEFVYNEKPIEPIDIFAKGVADKSGADISELRIKAPVGETHLSGKITDWEKIKYDLKIASTIDLMQTGTILPSGTALRGFGNFEGTVTGEGENYQVKGEVTSDSLAASNVTLKGLQVNATVNGENTIYEGNGKAIAEMLTFEDFRIDLPQLLGNIRGNGTDFKWVGELQAAAARSPQGTLASLFISDAVAEYKDKEFAATFGNARARNFSNADIEALDLVGRNIKVAYRNGDLSVDMPGLSAGTVKAEGTEMRGVDAGRIQVASRGERTEADIAGVKADSAQTKDAKLSGLTADNVKVADQNGVTDITARNVKAESVDASGTKANGLTTSAANIKIRGNQTDIETEAVRIAKVDADAATIGDLNIAGVRLSIKQGRIEGTSGDVTAGDVALARTAENPQGGRLENVRGYRPVFVLEPSGRYRASLDMSIGSGVVGSVRLGAARASVVATNSEVALNNLNAEVMDGKVNGNAVIAMERRGASKLDADFSNLDLGKLLALQGGRVIPIAGQTTGKANLTFAGTDIKNANGTLVADFTANAGSEQKGLIPLTGRMGLRATRGLFEIDYANLNTEKSRLDATGRFDLVGSNSELKLALNSADAGEIERLVRVLDISPEIESQLASNQIAFAGNFKFDGTVRGNLSDPLVDGNVFAQSVSMKGRELGSISTKVFVDPLLIELRDGVLQETNGGSATFSASIPQTGKNNISVKADLNRINTGNILAALPLESGVPETLKQVKAETTGKIDLSGLPYEMKGEAELRSSGGSIADQPFESMESRLTFQGTQVNLEKFDARFAEGYLTAKGTYQRDSGLFDMTMDGKGLQAARLRPLVTNDPDFPQFGGTVDLRAKATGEASRFATYNIEFDGVGQEVTVNNSTLGSINFTGTTQNQILKTNLNANFEGQQQLITATLDLGNENLPLRAETAFNQTQIAPFVALLRPPGSVEIQGKATGGAFIEGNLYARDQNGKGYFTAQNLQGTAKFSEFGVQINETQFFATEPIEIAFNTNEAVVKRTRFAGAGSNVIVSGTKALSDTAMNDLAVDGKINLRVLDLVSKNTFYSGVADVSVRLTGVNKRSKLIGSGSVDNTSISTFVGSERLNFERIKGRILFTDTQAQIEYAVGYLGGGKVTGSGGAVIENLTLQRFRLELRGTNVTAPLPKNFITTGDAEVAITGRREEFLNNQGKKEARYDTLIAGTIYGKRSVFTKDIDLADLISNRRERTLSEGTDAPLLGIPRLQLRLEGRNALIVKNNIADLTGSVSMLVTGDVDYPILTGRITANSGTLLFRNDRYDIKRGTLEYPPQADSEPVINLQAEADIKGYQVNVDLSGELSNLDGLTANVRSNPALPQADVISLITTGNLANTDAGLLSTNANSGINTAAELITDSLINNPVRRATDRLFGLNKFEIDPIISGKRLNPTARLTVGRQINKNLAVTYSTNLSEDQNQVLAFEYRVSNRLSFVAQYEQRSLTNVTRNNNNFSFEVRLRKRF